MKIVSRASTKKDKRAEGFQILHFHWSFSSDIMAVKGLKQTLLFSRFLKAATHEVVTFTEDKVKPAKQIPWNNPVTSNRNPIQSARDQPTTHAGGQLSQFGWIGLRAVLQLQFAQVQVENLPTFNQGGQINHDVSIKPSWSKQGLEMATCLFTDSAPF